MCESFVPSDAKTCCDAIKDTSIGQSELSILYRTNNSTRFGILLGNEYVEFTIMQDPKLSGTTKTVCIMLSCLILLAGTIMGVHDELLSLEELFVCVCCGVCVCFFPFT